jgi:hypothetical protein
MIIIRYFQGNFYYLQVKRYYPAKAFFEQEISIHLTAKSFVHTQ